MQCYWHMLHWGAKRKYEFILGIWKCRNVVFVCKPLARHSISNARHSTAISSSKNLRHAFPSRISRRTSSMPDGEMKCRLGTGDWIISRDMRNIHLINIGFHLYSSSLFSSHITSYKWLQSVKSRRDNKAIAWYFVAVVARLSGSWQVNEAVPRYKCLFGVFARPPMHDCAKVLSICSSNTQYINQFVRLVFDI